MSEMNKREIKAIVMSESAIREEAEKRVDEKLALGGKGTGIRRGETAVQMRERLIAEELDKTYEKHTTIILGTMLSSNLQAN